MEIQRPFYLERLKNRRHNKMVKVITGIRRCGKSYLLFNLYRDFLIADGVDVAHLIEVDLDARENVPLRDPDKLYEFIVGRLADEGMYYIFLDEIQLVDDFESVLNSLLRRRNVDVYVTGSNAKLLSKDVITEFRGRGDEVRLHPLSFSEFMSVYGDSKQSGLFQYMIYGGLPQIVERHTDEEKSNYLKSLFEETYLRDIKQRYSFKNDADFEELIDLISSNIGGLTNTTKIANTFKSVKGAKLTKETIKTYLDYLEDAFMIEKATRYDIKGNRYIDTPYKFYFEDLGLRNARLNFRQTEYTHLMENLVYNELRLRGFNVDVGIVNARKNIGNGQWQRTKLEIDFVCNQGSKRYYVQSAYRLASVEKVAQEQASLRNVDDSFKKIIVVGEEVPIQRNEVGITTMSIYDFLLKSNSLEL